MTNEDKAWEQFSKADAVSLGETSAQGMLPAILAELNSVKADTARLAQKIDGGAATMEGEGLPMPAEGGVPPMGGEAPMEGMPAGEGMEPPMEAAPEMPPMGADVPAAAVPPMPPLDESGLSDETLFALQDALSQVSDPEAIASLADIIKEYVAKKFGGAGAGAPAPEEIIEELVAGAPGEESPLGGDDVTLGMLDALMRSANEGGKDEADTKVVADAVEEETPEAEVVNEGEDPEEFKRDDSTVTGESAETPTEPTEPTEPVEPVKASDDASECDPVIQINLYLGKNFDDLLSENEKMGVTKKDELPTETFKVCDASEPATKSYKKSFNELFNEKARQMYGDDGRKYKLPMSRDEQRIAEYESIRKSIGSFGNVGGLRVGDVLTTMKGLYSRGARDIEKTYEPLIDEMVKNLDNTVGPQYTLPLFRSFDVDLTKIYEPVDLESFQRKVEGGTYGARGARIVNNGAVPKTIPYMEELRPIVKDIVAPLLVASAMGNRTDELGNFRSLGKIMEKGRAKPEVQDRIKALNGVSPVNDMTPEQIADLIAFESMMTDPEENLGPGGAPLDLSRYEGNDVGKYQKLKKIYDVINSVGGFPNWNRNAPLGLADSVSTNNSAEEALYSNTLNGAAIAQLASAFGLDPDNPSLSNLGTYSAKDMNDAFATLDDMYLRAIGRKAMEEGTYDDNLPIPGMENITPAQLLERTEKTPNKITSPSRVSEEPKNAASVARNMGKRSGYVKLGDRFLPIKDAFAEMEKDPTKYPPELLEKLRGDKSKKIKGVLNEDGFTDRDLVGGLLDDESFRTNYAATIQDMFGGYPYEGYKVWDIGDDVDLSGIMENPMTRANPTTTQRLTPEARRNIQEYLVGKIDPTDEKGMRARVNDAKAAYDFLDSHGGVGKRTVTPADQGGTFADDQEYMPGNTRDFVDNMQELVDTDDWMSVGPNPKGKYQKAQISEMLGKLPSKAKSETAASGSEGDANISEEERADMKAILGGGTS